MKKRFISFELILFLGISTLAGIIIGGICKYLQISPTDNINLIIDIYNKDLRPEPAEKIVFLALLFLTPITCWVSRKFSYIADPIKRNGAWSLLLLFLLLYVLFNSELLNYYLGYYGNKTYYAFFLYVFCLWLLLKPERIVSASEKLLEKYKIGKTAIISISLILIIVNSVPFRLLSISEIETNSVWSIDLDAVLYPVSQAIQGKSIFIDYSSQYGGYCALLGYIFQKFEFSLEKLSFIFLCLQIAGTGGLIYILKKEIHSKFILVLGCIFIGTMTFAIPLYWANIPDPYFQYWPIRFVFPALSIAALYLYLKNRNLKTASVFTALSIGSVFWNFDSGIILLVASVIFITVDLLYQAYTKSRTANLLLILFTVAGTLALALMLATNAVSFSFDKIFQYQLTFYHAGYYMLPMPIRYPIWLFYVLIYISGLLSFLYVFLRRKITPKHQIIFFTALLGLGLFSYYQGRSHILNLVAASAWPSYFIICFFCNDLWLKIKKGKGCIETRTLFSAMISIQIVAFIGLLIHLGTALGSCINKFNHLLSSEVMNKTVADEINFIKKESGNYKNCLILTKRQGLYYALTNVHSSIKGPGLVELISKKDLEILNAQLQVSDFDCIFLGIREDSSFEIFDSMDKALNNYIPIRTNHSKSIALLIRSRID